MASTAALHTSALLAGIVFLAGCGETIEASYSSLAEAKEAGAVSRGWIPGWLPQATTKIREVHNLDTNQSMVRFELSQGTCLEVPKSCKPVNPDHAPQPPFRRPWWPGDVPSTGPTSSQYTFFACGDEYVAYSSVSGHGFVWRAKAPRQ